MEEYSKVDLVSSPVIGLSLRKKTKHRSNTSLWFNLRWESVNGFLHFSLASLNTSKAHFYPYEFLQAKRTLKAQKLQDELASGKLDQAVSLILDEFCLI